jgi:hypothetical protein
MPQNKRIQANAERWSSLQPMEALQLPYSEDPNLKLCLTRQGESNLVKQNGVKKHYYHSNTDAKAEAKRWFKSLHLEGKQVIYVFGIGLGYYYRALRRWLKADISRAVIFLECDLAVIYRFFDTTTATQLLKDPQAYLYYFQDLQESQEIFNTLYWNFICTQMVVTSLKSYARYYPKLTADLQHKLVYEAAVKNSLVEEYLRYGANFFKNFYANLIYLPDSYSGDAMFQRFHGTPAIICGAGPSLLKHLPLMHTLRDKALIFAGGSALNAFSHDSLLPHFGAGIDPNPTQLLRLATSNGFETPFFYRNRLLPQAFRKIHGPKLYITGAGGYDVANWFEEELGIEAGEELHEGLNVVNFCVEIAKRMGCNPIIFVGMDLGFTDMQSYAAGVEKNVRITKKQLTATGDFNNDGVLRRDIYGKPFYTLWKWIAESEWIGEYAQLHPEVHFINATEGGLGIPGIPNIPLQEVANTHLQQSYDLDGLVHNAIQDSPLPPTVTKERVFELMRTMEESAMRCKEHLTILIEETEKTILHLEAEGTLPDILQSGRAALSETELGEEIAYTYILELFNHIYSRVLGVSLRHIRMSGKNAVEQTIHRLRVNIRRLVFLRDVCRVNIGLIGLAFRAYELGDMPVTEKMQDELTALVPTPH